MYIPDVTPCTGDGQGSCIRCMNEKNKWNRNWMCFLYKIKGRDGLYCEECVKEILLERKTRRQ